MDEIIIDGVIGGWDVDAQEIVSQLNQAKGDILVKLNSVGGSVIDGVTIYNALRKYDKGSVTVEIGAVAASIASYIALAGDKVIANSNSTFMIHLAWLNVAGNYIELRKAADISEGLSGIIANAYVAKTQMGKSDALSLMAKETFFYGNEILDAGFVDEIITIEDTTPKAEAYSMAMENLKACNNALKEHAQELDFEAVAQLLPEKEEEHQEEETPTDAIHEVVDLSAQQQREREIFILQQGVK